MKKQEAEIVELEDFRLPKLGNSDGGSDHFLTMIPGTVFCSNPNGSNASFIDEYMLGSKNGLTVLLLNRHTEKIERHIGNKFWKQNTLVQILHIPEKKEEEDGNSADV